VAAVALGFLAVLGWTVHQRNAVWESEAMLWQNAMEASPRNGRAMMNLGLTHLDDRDVTVPLDYMSRANRVTPGDPAIEINLGLAYSRLSQPKEAEASFRNAIGNGSSYSPAWSAYAQWLVSENRLVEAQEKASRAVQLDPYDVAGRRILMDILAQQHQWAKLQALAQETLRLLRDDPDGQRTLLVAQTGIDDLHHATENASSQPTVDHYLRLSVLYYEAERYQDSIDAAWQALKLNPNTGEAYGNIASAYHTMGNHLDETIAALQEEVKLNPDLPSARSNLEFELAVKKGEIRDDSKSRSIGTTSEPRK
jgi:tetratricopeptide (TPR) repeat protein